MYINQSYVRWLKKGKVGGYVASPPVRLVLTVQEPNDNTLTCTHNVFAYNLHGTYFWTGTFRPYEASIVHSCCIKHLRSGLLETHLAVKQKLPSSVLQK